MCCLNVLIGRTISIYRLHNMLHTPFDVLLLNIYVYIHVGLQLGIYRKDNEIGVLTLE